MGEIDKRYEAFQIFEQIQAPEEDAKPLPEKKKQDLYYEIEYDACPLPGVGKFVLKSNQTEEKGAIPLEPPRDEIRETFNQMRNIARENRQQRFHTKFYDKRVQEENSKIFYRQGMFMVDFEDSYEKTVPYSSYFPDYQMMGYDQLRTYFTWRTQVRQGNITDVSLSYAFLYIYELLNNIGVENPQDALDKLMFFWDAFRVYDKTIDKYVLKWLKDYHIYYELRQSFREFIDENDLGEYYPKLLDQDDNFDLYCSISKYDIRKSVFYKDNAEEVRKCFHDVMERLRDVFSEGGMDLEKAIFQPVKNMSQWAPFKGALFYPHLKQQDRRVVLSEKEIYICSKNQWTFSTVLTTDSGKRFIGYCLKQMEAVLRKAKKYKHKLSASMDMLSPVMADELNRSGIALESAVTSAAMEFFREANKTVVRVDREALDKIRQESLITQERLIVPEEAEISLVPDPLDEDYFPAKPDSEAEGVFTERSDAGAEAAFSGGLDSKASKSKSAEESPEGDDLLSDEWEDLKEALTESERKALFILLYDKEGIRKYADERNVMLEVLMDGINEKAMDYIGDNLLDGEFAVYEDYVEQVKEMVGER